MSERVRCCVPFCGRTRKPGCNEWICSGHWANVPRRLRRRKFLFERRYRKLFGNNAWHIYPGGSPDRIMAVRLDRLCDLAWQRCKKAAIEGAAGL